MQEPILHQMFSVAATAEEDVFIAKVDITDAYGNRYECDYVSREEDPHGLAPLIWDNVLEWIIDEKPVAPYVAPTMEEIRAAFPVLTPRQLRLQLVASGYLISTIQTILETIPDASQRETALIEWEYATRFERNHPLIAQLGASLSLSGTEIDTMWEAASKL